MSAEIEYKAIVVVLKNLKWIKDLLSYMGIVHSVAIYMYCDSKYVLHIAPNHVFRERIEHMESDCILSGMIYKNEI